MSSINSTRHQSPYGTETIISSTWGSTTSERRIDLCREHELNPPQNENSLNLIEHHT